MLRRPQLAALALALMTAACTSKGEGDAQDDGEGSSAATVQLGKAHAGALEEVHPLLGQVRATLQAQLAAGEAGEVLEVAVREGDRVERGDLLVDIDPALARARMRGAAAQRRQVAEQREQAERDAVRLEEAGNRLVAAREIEQANSEQAQLQARQAELGANVQEARAILDRLRVEAPFDGQVKSRQVDPGDWVSSGDPVLELVGIEALEILADVSADIVPLLEEGQRAELHKAGQSVPAEVRGVVRALDQATRTARVRLEPMEHTAWLLPGGTVDVRFTVRRETGDGSVIVPRDAIVRGAVGTRVVRAVDGKAKPVPVEVVATSQDEALVRAQGLSPGDSVVVRGNERLRPGQPLEVVERDTPSERAGDTGGRTRGGREGNGK